MQRSTRRCAAIQIPFRTCTSPIQTNPVASSNRILSSRGEITPSDPRRPEGCGVRTLDPSLSNGGSVLCRVFWKPEPGMGCLSHLPNTFQLYPRFGRAKRVLKYPNKRLVYNHCRAERMDCKRSGTAPGGTVGVGNAFSITGQ